MATVLIVDDEEATVFGLRMVLEDEGIQVFTAPDRARAEELLSSHPVDVLLTDVRLAGLNDVGGIELLRFLREKHLSTHAIVVTGYGAPGVLQTAFDLGAAFYFEKPVNLQVLAEALTELGVPCSLTTGGRS